MKIRLLLAAAMLLLGGSLFAQTGPENFAAMGMGWNQYVSPQINGNLLYAHRLDDAAAPLYSFTFVDLISQQTEKFSVATSITTGIAKQFLQVNTVRVFATTGVGVLAGAENVGYSWTSGGAVSVPLGKGWALLPNVRVIKSSLTDFQWIGGVMLGWGK